MTVVVPFISDGPTLRECLAHLARQTYRSFDIILVPDDASALASEHVRVIPSGRVLPNRKRQIAARTTTAPILAFIDDDAYPHPDWLAAAVRHFADPGVVAAGGPAVTPAGDTPECRASGAVYASPLVTSSTRYRYIPQAQRDVEALPSCNLLIRRDAFLRDVEATVHYWPGEDILTCLYATRAGERIVYDPAVLVFHHRRRLFGPHVRQVWSYGVFRGTFLRRFSRSAANLAYASPALFVLGHGVMLAALTRRPLRAPALLAMGAYATLVARSALREARNARTNPWLVAAGIYLTHVAYGAGSITGWLSPQSSSRAPSRDNHQAR